MNIRTVVSSGIEVVLRSLTTLPDDVLFSDILKDLSVRSTSSVKSAALLTIEDFFKDDPDYSNWKELAESLAAFSVSIDRADGEAYLVLVQNVQLVCELLSTLSTERAKATRQLKERLQAARKGKADSDSEEIICTTKVDVTNRLLPGF